MLTYAYTLTPDSNGTYLIQYPDLPEGAAVSETEGRPGRRRRSRRRSAAVHRRPPPYPHAHRCG